MGFYYVRRFAQLRRRYTAGRDLRADLERWKASPRYSNEKLECWWEVESAALCLGVGTNPLKRLRTTLCGTHVLRGIEH
jgi:hypothetical protein